MKNNLFTPKVFLVIAPGFKKDQISNYLWKNKKELSIIKPTSIKKNFLNYEEELQEKINF